MDALLNDADRRAQFFMLRGERGHRRIVAPLAREQRLEMPLEMVPRAFASVDGVADPLDRPDARVVRLVADIDVAVDVIDEHGVEFLLARQHPAEQAPRARREARLQPAATRRSGIDDLVERVEAFELMPIGRRNRRRLARQRPTSPSTGLLAVAYIFLGMRPDRLARRPAMTACFIASAIDTGSCAPAMAVFISTPSAPSSIATVASDAVPTPASTMTGTRENSRMMRMLLAFGMPSPEPIGAPSGITAAAPASSSLRQTIGSSVVYGSTTKPSRTRTRVASISASLSGNSVCSSPITSSFTQFDRPASRPSRAVRNASSAVEHPAVLGSRNTLDV